MWEKRKLVNISLIVSLKSFQLYLSENVVGSRTAVRLLLNIVPLDIILCLNECTACGVLDFVLMSKCSSERCSGCLEDTDTLDKIVLADSTCRPLIMKSHLGGHLDLAWPYWIISFGGRKIQSDAHSPINQAAL